MGSLILRPALGSRSPHVPAQESLQGTRPDHGPRDPWDRRPKNEERLVVAGKKWCQWCQPYWYFLSQSLSLHTCLKLCFGFLRYCYLWFLHIFARSPLPYGTAHNNPCHVIAWYIYTIHFEPKSGPHSPQLMENWTLTSVIWFETLCLPLPASEGKGRNRSVAPDLRCKRVCFPTHSQTISYNIWVCLTRGSCWQENWSAIKFKGLFFIMVSLFSASNPFLDSEYISRKAMHKEPPNVLLTSAIPFLELWVRPTGNHPWSACLYTFNLTKCHSSHRFTVRLSNSLEVQ